MGTRTLLLALVLAATPGSAATARTPVDTEGCRDPRSLARLSGCTILECTHRDYDEAELQSGPLDAEGEFPRALVEGRTSVVSYVCPPELDLEEIARRTSVAARRAGFRFVHTGGMFYNHLPGFTARKGSQWLQVVSEPLADDRPGYTVTAVSAVAAETPHPSPRPPRKAGAPPRRKPSGN